MVNVDGDMGFVEMVKHEGHDEPILGLSVPETSAARSGGEGIGSGSCNLDGSLGLELVDGREMVRVDSDMRKGRWGM